MHEIMMLEHILHIDEAILCVTGRSLPTQSEDCSSYVFRYTSITSISDPKYNNNK